MYLDPDIKHVDIEDTFGLTRSGVDSRAQSLKLGRVTRSRNPKQIPPETTDESVHTQTVYQPIEVKPLTIIKRERTEEEQVLELSDIHAGRWTTSYDISVLKQRLDNLLKSVASIGQLHQNLYPLRTLNIFGLGDWVQNERVEVVPWDEVQKTVEEQIFDVLIPELSTFLVSLLQIYPNIKLHCVRGNHGKVAKLRSPRTNWDQVTYKALALALSEFDRISFDIETERFYKLVEIQGRKFLLIHGDQINMYNSIPWYGLVTRGLRWHTSIEANTDDMLAVLSRLLEGKISKEEAGKLLVTFPYEAVTLGHFHNCCDMDFNTIRFLMNGCFVSDDEYVLHKLGMKGSTSQLTFGVHPKGITWSYKLDLTR